MISSRMLSMGLRNSQNFKQLKLVSSQKMSTLNIPSETLPAALDSVKAVVTVLPDHAWYNMTGHYQVFLDTVQVSTGLPWWAVLLGTGFAVRSCLFPINILHEKKLTKNIKHVAELAKLKTEMTGFFRKGDHVGSLTKQGEIKYYKEVNNFNWTKSANWFLVPTFMTMSLNFFSIRNLAEISYQPLQDTNFLWLTSLCQSDPYFLFPAMNAAAVAYVFKYGIDTAGSENPLSQLLSSKKALMFTMVVMGGIQSMFPSALLLYWFASNIYGMAVVRPLMNNDKFRIKVGLLSLEEKKEAFKALPTAKDIFGDASKTYQEVREDGHAEDVEARKAKLNELDTKESSNTNIADLRESLDKLKSELKIKDEELSKLKGETEEQIQFLKNSENLQHVEKHSSKKEQAE